MEERFDVAIIGAGISGILPESFSPAPPALCFPI